MWYHACDSRCREVAGYVGGGASHVAMASEVLQELDFAQGALGENLLAEDIGNLLDGDAFVGLVVDGGTARRGRSCQQGRG